LPASTDRAGKLGDPEAIRREMSGLEQGFKRIEAEMQRALFEYSDFLASARIYLTIERR
jgi:hypothetical protein